MATKRDPRILDRADAFPGSDNRKGYVVDLSEGRMRNPDCGWPMRTIKQATAFLQLVDSGIDARTAQHIVYQ